MAKKYILTDIITKEVSIVTTGANKKTFNIVKSSEGALLTEALTKDNQEAIAKLLPMLLEKANEETLKEIGIVSKNEPTEEKTETTEDKPKVEKSDLDTRIDSLNEKIDKVFSILEAKKVETTEEKEVEKSEETTDETKETTEVEKSEEKDETPSEVAKSQTQGDSDKTPEKSEITKYSQINLGGKKIK